MKKLFLLVLIPASLLFHSCLDNETVEPSAVEPGVMIYNKGRAQADLDMDPMILALKLNTLIATAEDAGKSYSTVEVNIGGDGTEEGGDEEWVNLMDRLFGKNNDLTKSGNEWTIDFKTTSALEKERYYRQGDITINTNGRTLENLSGGSWEITVPSSGYDVIYTSGRVKYISRFDHYSISAVAGNNNAWTVTGYSTAYYDGYEQLAAKWPFEYEVTMLGDGTFVYDEAVRATFMVSGGGEGVPVFADYKLRYTAKDLKYKPRCYLWYIFGGVENVEVERSAFTEEDLPATYVKYTWFDNSASGSCYLSLIISYNGVSANG